MLKIPNVKNNLETFLYITNVINENYLELFIIYKKKNHNGIVLNKMQNYGIFTDIRYPNIEIINDKISSTLNSAQNTNTSVILKIYKERDYIYLNDLQFTGELIKN